MQFNTAIARLMELRSREMVLLKGCSFALVSFILAIFLYQTVALYRPFYGLGVDTGVFPEGTVAFMKKEKLTDGIFNRYGFGGYMTFNHSEAKVFMDSRTPTLYTPYFFWLQRQGMRSLEKWERVVAEYDIDVALIKSAEAICETLFYDDGWTAVSFDDASVLFLKEGGRHQALIDRWGMRKLNPCVNNSYTEITETDKAVLLEMEAEVRRVMDYNEGVGLVGRVAIQHLLLGRVYTSLGGDYLDRAVDEYKTAVRVFPKYAIYYDLGLAYAKLKRYELALQYFDKARYGVSKSDLGTGLIYHEIGEDKKAVRYLKRYVKHAGDGAEDFVFKPLGLSCFRLGNFDCASHNFKKAVFFATSDKDRAWLYFQTGSSLFGVNDYSDGVLYFRKAVHIDPEVYGKKLERLAEEFSGKGWKEKATAIEGLLSAK